MLEAAFVSASDISRCSNNTFPVTYDDAGLRSVHRQFVEMIFPLITLPNGRELSHDVTTEYLTELRVVLAKQVARSALFYKHEAYSNEKEYRFLQLHRADVPPPGMKFRARLWSDTQSLIGEASRPTRSSGSVLALPLTSNGLSNLRGIACNHLTRQKLPFRKFLTAPCEAHRRALAWAACMIMSFIPHTLHAVRHASRHDTHEVQAAPVATLGWRERPVIEPISGDLAHDDRGQKQSVCKP